METSESSRSRSKRSLEDSRDARNDEDEDWEKRKHRSGKSRKYDNPEEVDDYDNGRRKSSGERNDTRKKSGGSNRVDSADEDEYEARRDSRSKILSKETEDRGERRSGDSYRDRDQEGSRRSRDDEIERSSSRKERLKSSESSQSKVRSRPESSHDIDHEKIQDRDSKYSDRKESSRDKGHEDREQDRNPSRRRWDEVETGRKAEESSYRDKSDPRGGKASEHDRHGPSRDRAVDARNELGENRSRVDSSYEKGGRSINRDDRRADGESSRNRGRSEVQDEDYKQGTSYRDTRSDIAKDDKQRSARERSPGLTELVEPNTNQHSDKPHGDKGEKHRQDRDAAYGSRDEVETRERSFSMDEDGYARMRDRSGRDVQHDRSRTPERSSKHRRESDERDRGFSESDNERGVSVKSKEWEDGYRDDRASKGKDSGWDDKNREREGSRDYWRRSQTRHDLKDGEKEVDHLRDWDSQRREQDRTDREKVHGRPGYRKDARMRSDGVRSEHTDSIEIRPNKNLDFGKEESVSTFPGRRNEGLSQQDFASGASADEWSNPPEDKGKMAYGYGDDLQERYHDDGSSMDQNSLAGKGRGQKGDMNSGRSGAGQASSGGLQPSFGNFQGSSSFSRTPQQGQKGGRPARGGRGRTNARDAQRVGMPLPLIAPPPFSHLGLPPGAMQPIGPNIPHTPGPPIGPGVFLPPFGAPLVWPGARGIDMNMLPVPPNLPPIPPPGPGGPRFAPNMGTAPAHGMYFNQAGAGRGVSANISDSGFNGAGPIGRGLQHDKTPSNWGPHRTGGPSGKAPSRGEQNDYSQNFVDTGMRPQNFIRELEITSVVEDYPKLRELIQRKDEIVSKSASPPMYFKCDLKEHILSPEFFGTKFDVILVDPPWEEYAHRAPGATDHIDCWTFEEIQNLKIEAIADTPSFIFLWVGDGVGLEQGRQCLKKWGFRRCEDICWVKTNKKNTTSGLRHDSNTLFQHSKEHCLMGIKGTVRRSTDGHIIHANIDTDIIIAEEPTDGSTEKPEDMYRIIEHFSLGRRRLELFGVDRNIRAGWLTVGKGLSFSNFNAESYTRNFCDKEGKVWQGGGGRNPPPDAPHLVQTTPEIESLRPRSPPPKNQQQQPIPLMSSTSSNNRRPTGNSPQNPTVPLLSGMNHDPSASAEPLAPVPWAAPQMGGLRGAEFGHGSGDDRLFDGYGFNVPYVQPMGEHFEYEAR
ncbi:putative mRNA (2'-O-methyladenosine-N(6)-)-methyltransferase [Dioscorea sansibarensis]